MSFDFNAKKTNRLTNNVSDKSAVVVSATRNQKHLTEPNRLSVYIGEEVLEKLGWKDRDRLTYVWGKDSDVGKLCIFRSKHGNLLQVPKKSAGNPYCTWAENPKLLKPIFKEYPRKSVKYAITKYDTSEESNANCLVLRMFKEEVFPEVDI